MRCIALSVLLLSVCAISGVGQANLATRVAIAKAEDARRFDEKLASLIISPDAAVRHRAAIGAGRIGDETALPSLHEILKADPSADVRAAAAFAIGEIESIRNAYGLLDPLKAEKDVQVRARIIEAAGKLAAANPNNAVTPALKRVIFDALQNETNRDVVLAALTAALRARPEGSELAVVKFLTFSDARIRADAANTLARLRAKNANELLRRMLENDLDPIARANAARALGAAEAGDAVSQLTVAAVSDADSRVRVSAIRSLAALKAETAAASLVKHGGSLLDRIGKSRSNVPDETSELLEIASALGRIRQGKPDSDTVSFLKRLRTADKHRSPETEIALARITTSEYVESLAQPAREIYGSASRLKPRDRRAALRSFVSALGELGTAAEDDKNKTWRDASREVLEKLLVDPTFFGHNIEPQTATFVLPEVLQALAQYKSAQFAQVLRAAILHPDVFVRAAAAGLLADQGGSAENLEALKKAFAVAMVADKHDNDAQLAIIDAIWKLDKKESVGVLLTALASPDYLVRKRAIALLGDDALQKDFPGVAASLTAARKERRHHVLARTAMPGTKLGQILNTEADYRRALSRTSGSVTAVLVTEKGTFAIELFPEDAPLTVDNFVMLARARYFDGLEVHRVVPNFVMQDGDPRGDGNGGPGWSIRCEVNMRPYERGAVGMALSGKDTGGSQWFVTHSPQPHLDGGYTVFGRVSEADMKVVDRIARGDKIVTVRIQEKRSPRR